MSTAELVLDPPAPYVHLGDHVWLGASPQDTDTLHKNGSDGQGKYVLASSDSTRLGGLTLNWCEQTNPPTLSNISTAMFEFRPRTVVEMDADEDEHNNNQHQPQQHSHHQPHQQKQPAAEHKKRKEVQAEYDHSDEDVRFCKGYAVTCGQAVTLYHPHSRRYVAVKRNTPARTEPSNLRVVLVGDPSKASNFKIQPSSKLRVEGDPVLTDDKISLECADIPDHFLNKSVKPNEGKDSCVFEVNCAVTRTEFTIREAAAVKHRRYPLQYHPYQDDGRIRGCDMVQLYHRGLSAYMAAEGSFALDEPVVNDREGEEDVHLRLRPQNKRQPRTLRPPTTAVTFWQVELVNNSCWGRPVQWEHDPDLDRFKTQPLRLKHATTQLFLSFDDNLKPRLQRNPDDSTSFQLAQLDDDTSVSSCATVGIQHVKSEQWLYAEFNSDKDRFKRKEAEESIARWDGATLVKLKLRERGGTREFCDVFQVTLVKPSQVFSVGFVAGALPAIATYIKGLAGEQVGSAALAPKAFTSALRDLESFMFRDNKPVRERQKLLRNFHVVDKLVELLSKSMETRAGLDPGHGHTKTPKHVLNAACNVLKAYVVGNSRKNEHYLAKHIPFFQEHMGAPLEIESLYTELVRDDLQVVDSLKEDDVKQIVQKLKRMSSADNAHSDKLEREFLMFLGVLCVCEDTPVPSKQNTIARLLFDDEHDHVDVTRLFPSFIVPDPPEDQLGDAPFLTDEHKMQLQRQEPWLDLLCKLCKGWNRTCIERIRSSGLLSFKQCEDALTRLAKWCQSLPAPQASSHKSDHGTVSRASPANMLTLYAKYLEVMHHVFLGADVDIPRRVLKPGNPDQPPAPLRVRRSMGSRQLSFSTDADCSENGIASGNSTSGVRDACKVTFTHILEQLNPKRDSTNSKGIPWHKSTHGTEALAQTLDLLNHLLRVAPTADSSRGKTPRRYQLGRSFRRMTRSHRRANAIAMEHSGAIDVDDLESVLAHVLRVIEPFLPGKKTVTGDEEAVGQCLLSALKIVELVIEEAANTRLMALMQDFYCSEHPEEYPHRSKQRKQTEFKQLRVALEEGKLSESDALEYVVELRGNFSWLTPEWKPRDSNASRSIVDFLMGMATFDNARVKAIAPRLVHRLFYMNADLLADARAACFATDEGTRELHQQLISIVPQLRHLAAGLLTGDQANMYTTHVADLIDECYEGNDTDEHDTEERPVRHDRQKLVVNAGVPDILFDVLDKPQTDNRVLCCTFNLLRVLAVKNRTVQKLMFYNMDVMLGNVKTRGEVNPGDDEQHWEDAMAFALTEAFSYFPRLCFTVRNDHLIKLVPILRRKKCKVPHLLSLLSAVTKEEVQGVPLERNQAMIMQFLTKSRAELLEPINTLYGKGDTPSKQDDVSDPSAAQADIEMYKSKLLHLLADCASGKNGLAENKCREFFSADDIIRDLEDNAVPLNIKTAGFRFMLWVNLATEKANEDVRNFLGRLWRCVVKMAEKLQADQRLMSKLHTFLHETYVPFVEQLLIRSDSTGKATQGQVTPNIAARLDAMAKQEPKPEAITAITRADWAVLIRMLTMLSALKNGGAHVSDDYKQDGARAHKSLDKAFNAFSQQLHRLLNKDTESGGMRVVETRCLACGKEKETRSEIELPLPKTQEFEDEVNLFAENLAAATDEHQDWVKHLIDSLEAEPARDKAVQWQFSDRRRQMTTNCRTMRVIRGILQKHAESSPHADSSDSSSFESLQNRLSPAIVSIVKLFRTESLELFREGIATLTPLLRNGNKLVQARMNKYFKGTREEFFFHALHDNMKGSTEVMKAIRAARQMQDMFRPRSRRMPKTITDKVTTIRSQRTYDQKVNSLRRRPRPRSDYVPMEVMKKAQSMAPADASAEKDMAKLFERSNRDLITILRLMQLMGEGFNTQLKEYLRFQKDNYRSVNLLGQTISLFRDLISRISKSQLTFLEFQTIVTLVELTQGCPTNQDDAFTSHIAEHINHLLRTGVNDLGFTLPQEAKGAYPNRRWRAILPWRRSASITATPDPEQPPSAPNQPSQQSQKMLCPKRARVIFELGKLLLALLENDDEETKRRAGVMIDMLNFEAIAETMIEFYEWQEEPACVLKCDEDWPESQVGDLELEQIGFTFYQVWARFKDLTGQDCWDGVMDADDKRFLEAKKFYVTEGSCLEVEFSGVTHKIHFFDSKAPQVFNNEKKRIIYTVSTDNTPHKEKLQKFKEKCKSIAKDVEQRERVANVFKPLLHWSSWSYSLICLTLIIQAILLAWVTTTATAEGRRPIHRPGWLPDWVLLALSIAHTVLSVLTTVSHVLLHRPTLPQFLKRWRTKKDKAQPTAMSVHDQLPQCPCWSCFNKQRTEGKRTTSAAPGQTWSKAMRRARRGRRKMKDEVEFNVTTGRASYKRTRWPLLSATLLHHFLLVGMSLAGTLSNPFFFTYHLFHIIPVNEILRRVLKALVKRFIDLMLVAALIVAMIFTYSILVFVYFRDSVSREDGFWCDTFGQCFLSSVRFTMIEGFGGVLVPESSVWHTNAGRAIFDMCFFILVTCLGGGLILGIIIDTFQDLRNDKWSIDDAMKSKCFICGRTSFQLSQQQGETARASDWQEHVSEQHNMWDYLYFYIYLLHKDENEYTHHEHKVFYMKSNELEFPTQQGKSLVSEAACCL